MVQDRTDTTESKELKVALAAIVPVDVSTALSRNASVPLPGGAESVGGLASTPVLRVASARPMQDRFSWSRR